MKSNFVLRTITGIVFVAVLVGSILYSPLSFGVLFTLITALSVHEFGVIINRSGRTSMNKNISALSGAYLFLALQTCLMHQVSGASILIPYLLLVLYLLISELYRKQENPIANWGSTMLSQLYVALPFALLNVLAFHTDSSGSVSYNPILPLSIFMFIWLSDTVPTV